MAHTRLLAGLIAVASLTFPELPRAEERPFIPQVFEQIERFGDVFEHIRQAYVEEVSDEDLIRAAIDGMLAALDPHSAYLPPEEYEAIRDRTRGTFGGIGVEVDAGDGNGDGFVRVKSAPPGAPAARAGIKPGDLITHVDGTPTRALTLREASRRIRGPIGTPARLSVLRDGLEQALEVEIIRENIRVRSVRPSLHERVLVVKITSFNAETAAMLEESVAAWTEAAGGAGRLKGIVLDLRGNPGGLLDQAVKVSDAFLDGGDIVTTRGREARRTARRQAAPGELLPGKPMVVLIDDGSASAAEIVAGALQDNKRAIVLGTQSFGKGSVQTIMPVGRRGAVKLTTSRYYTPSGRSIQALGIAPDIVVEQGRAEASEQETRLPSTEADTARATASEMLSASERALARSVLAARDAAARLRAEDYQLAYALDAIAGMSALAGLGSARASSRPKPHPPAMCGGTSAGSPGIMVAEPPTRCEMPLPADPPGS